jgi:hypothetical protein
MCWLLSAGVACADAEGAAPAFEIPPAPRAARPRNAWEVHGSFAWPLNNGSLCPSGVGGVLQGGGGVGGSFERRWPTGFGAFAAYDLWFLDTDSVYELGVQQAWHGGLRYTMPTEVIFHPLFDVSLGLMGYGDTFRVATVGALIQVFAGAEVELSESIGLRFGFGLRVFSHGRFRTERDHIVRGSDGVFAESVFLELGLTVM